MYRRNRAGVVKVRLAEIDAPEVDQPYGTEARYVLCAMICGCDVDSEPRGTSYDRIVGLIRVHSIDTSQVMVRAEAAWDYARYAPNPVIAVLEAKGRAGHLGLRAPAHPVAPWGWRHRGAGRFR